MGTLGLETVLISNVVQSVLLSVSGDPADGSSDLEGRVLKTNIPQLSGLLARNTVTGLIAIRQLKQTIDKYSYPQFDGDCSTVIQRQVVVNPLGTDRLALVSFALFYIITTDDSTHAKLYPSTPMLSFS